MKTREIMPWQLFKTARLAAKNISQRAYKAGRAFPAVFLHWSAGDYTTNSRSYHITFDNWGVMKYNIPLTEATENAVYMRNSQGLSLSLLCASGATSKRLGSYPPTQAQIEAMAISVACLSLGLGLPITLPYFMTHGEAADNQDIDIMPGLIRTHEPYGPRTTCERWDLEYLGTDESPAFNPWASDGSRGGDVLRGKGLWYRAQILKAAGGPGAADERITAVLAEKYGERSGERYKGEALD